ncbi:PREDICTED: ATP-dependent DNA helicase Q-like SIM isoform X2 [Priapulus caudatus]|uniref:DNA 3'-5' helicase n=1 Tax=Priapulus caudatus TaxID=37621 RepID=A0ABM1E3N5_PRICU|nr:PREDICTED: ATP-dependent DNA helicase Q-like SIM isoform X2 [Priapulus caudatus]
MDKETVADLHKGLFTLVFSSPEAIMSPTWWEWVRLNRKKIALLCIDEAHCLTKWGETFRDHYLSITELGSRLPKTPVMMLTATATPVMVEQIIGHMHLKQDAVVYVTLLPDRPNIHLEVKTVNIKSFEDTLGWYLAELKSKVDSAPKAIIYARQVDQVGEIYHWLMRELGSSAFAIDTPAEVHNRTVEMYHAATDVDSQRRIASTIADTTSSIRCVVATIAFGLGINISNVDYVLHWGPSGDIMSYWQEVGRCARDGRVGKAILYIYPGSIDKRRVDEPMRNFLLSAQTGEQCIRKSILQFLFLPGMNVKSLEHCSAIPSCCSVCNKEKK